MSRLLSLFLSLAALISAGPLGLARPQTASPSAPAVTKVEPPNWWIGLTPDLQLLLYGHNLEATHVACNLNTLHISRTQATADGDYLFIWLKIAPDARSGTAVCRIKTGTGETTFELPLSTRSPTLGKFQGLAPQDAMYLIMPDRFADGDPTNDEPTTQESANRDAGNSSAASSKAAEKNRSEHTTTLDRANPRAYHGGDLRGIREHLAYLKDLGVAALWLTPIVKNGAAQDYHGYGAVDLYAVEPHLGTLDDYRELVAAAHQQKMKIFFDIVPNHVGPLHPWVKNPPLPDWFHGTVEQHLNSSAGVDASFYGRSIDAAKANDLFETLTDPHAPAALNRSLTDGWFFGVLPDLNTENPAVAQYLLQNAIWWSESSGLDGLRVDTFPYVPKRFWANWNGGLHSIYPYLTTIGEVYHPDPEVTSFFVGGQRRWDGIDSGLTTVFDFPLNFAIREVLLHGAPAGKIADVLRQDGLYPRAENLITFCGNHDQARFSSGEYQSLAKLKLAYGLALTLRGIPELYYGDEIALPGGGDPDNRRDFPGGWIGDTQNAFTASGRTPRQQEMFAYVQTLLRLRHEHVALQTGRLWHVFSDRTAYVFLRETEEEHLLVAFNDDAAPRTLHINVKDTPLQGLPAAALLFGEGGAEIMHYELRLTLPAESITVFNMY
ncbi:MAG TPA: alpha-amylase family glycosyl hydrolase [Candidatus Acidoferrum sp.]|nr:alpha-amylase family glycosyl hydrolase [Candidatus Acidoferrum sp.]